MADDYSQRVQKVCRTLCKQRGLSNDSVSEMRALLFNPTSEHDEVGTEILLEAVVATICERVRSSTVISQRTFLGSYSFNFDSYSFNFDFVKSRLSKERRVYCRLLD